MSLEQQLIDQLQQLTPIHLEVINESSGHAGYYPGKESHFKVVIVSEQFNNLRLVQRHQQVYAAVHSLLAAGGGAVHALAIHAYAPNEWQGDTPTSPECAHAPKVG
ncbi:BolA family protein [Acinetobacter sp. MD2(2019)]|uniref:BolA family protein n=1 Tax=Acinetobacter sp. MD2(2019) TaxID=2605273 RepID=UPI002D1F8AD7|nr:BolA family protein [Acinetobacter sp. MD2(2019)]MEB3754611.1 BolA family transcriptional regulator [Acinetobacter sp. MD2(2019)]